MITVYIEATRYPHLTQHNSLLPSSGPGPGYIYQLETNQWIIDFVQCKFSLLDFSEVTTGTGTVRLDPSLSSELRQQQTSGEWRGDKKQVMEEKNLIYWAQECCLQLNTKQIGTRLSPQSDVSDTLTIINWKSPLPRGILKIPSLNFILFKIFALSNL